MCIQRQWKDLQPIITDTQLTLLGTRSDGVIVRVKANYKQNVEDVILIRKVKRMLDDLNSFRNCECSANSPCNKHRNNHKEK